MQIYFKHLASHTFDFFVIIKLFLHLDFVSKWIYAIFHLVTVTKCTREVLSVVNVKYNVGHQNISVLAIVEVIYHKFEIFWVLVLERNYIQENPVTRLFFAALFVTLAGDDVRWSRSLLDYVTLQKIKVKKGATASKQP